MFVCRPYLCYWTISLVAPHSRWWPRMMMCVRLLFDRWGGVQHRNAFATSQDNRRLPSNRRRLLLLDAGRAHQRCREESDRTWERLAIFQSVLTSGSVRDRIIAHGIAETSWLIAVKRWRTHWWLFWVVYKSAQNHSKESWSTLELRWTSLFVFLSYASISDGVFGILAAQGSYSSWVV